MGHFGAEMGRWGEEMGRQGDEMARSAQASASTSISHMQNGGLVITQGDGMTRNLTRSGLRSAGATVHTQTNNSRSIRTIATEAERVNKPGRPPDSAYSMW